MPKQNENKIWKIDDEVEFHRICKALSSSQRMTIMRAITRKTMTVSEIAKLLGLAQSTVTVHIQELEAVGLIRSVIKPGPARGQRKLCSPTIEGLMFRFKDDDDKMTISMPVGHFVDYSVEPTCGMNSAGGVLVKYDVPANFNNPNRADAQNVWTGCSGYFEYRFQVLPEADKAKGIEVSAEVCSEFYESKNDHLSDISLWVDGQLIGTYYSLGDMGGRRGRFTPPWVPVHWTQYGFLVKWKVDNKGCWVNDKKVSSSITYKKLDLYKKSDIRVRLGVAQDAKNSGGLNLFGKHYGDFEQDIVLHWLK